MDLPVFDISSDEFQADPLPAVRQMHQAGELVNVKVPLFGCLPALTRYRAVDDFLRDSKRFARSGKAAGKRSPPGLNWWMPKVFRAFAKNMLATDGADHRRLRSLVDQAFLKRNVDSMRPGITRIADTFLDDLERQQGDGPVDLLDDFCRQFPLAVICELLGLPDEDRPRFTRWFGSLGRFRGWWSFAQMIPGLIRARAYLLEQFRSCRNSPRPGLITQLVLAEQQGGRLSEPELLAMVFLLLVAGHETTTHLISNGLLALLDHEDQKRQLTDDWSLAPTAIDELLRYTSPVQMSKVRYATEAMEISGQVIHPGQMMIGLLVAANFDSDQFSDPFHLDLQRSPNRHLSFGSGIHVCLGMKLAKLETAIALERLFTRFPSLYLACDRKEIRWRSRIGLRSLESLPIRLQ
ncbi:cytochrome P450 family protein [Roseiconus nitratireducens]|nr:cytochrome P450 [Roseiconus nitratireducens]